MLIFWRNIQKQQGGQNIWNDGTTISKCHLCHKCKLMSCQKKLLKLLKWLLVLKPEINHVRRHFCSEGKILKEKRHCFEDKISTEHPCYYLVKLNICVVHAKFWNVIILEILWYEAWVTARPWSLVSGCI